MKKRFSLIELIIGVVVSAVLFGAGAVAASEKVEQINLLSEGINYNNEQIAEAMALLNDDFDLNELNELGNMELNAIISLIAQSIGEDEATIQRMTVDLENALAEVIQKYENGDYSNN